MKRILQIVIVFISLMLIFFISGQVFAEKQESQNLNRAVLKIDSLSCGGCFSTISAGLAPLEGYSGMGANLFRKLIAVDFAEPLTAEQISEKLAEVGYPGKLETVDTITKKESFAYLESKRTGFSSGRGGGCCSGGSPPQKNKQSSSGLLPSPGGSCCAVPGASQNSKDL
ncbi:MAG: heavy-metal-associated domain-containing protein [Desulfobacteraceae bacterium]|nr:heavy-metal-associated domain-containing protein [Desulfobacteraceae bacterium]